MNVVIGYTYKDSLDVSSTFQRIYPVVRGIGYTEFSG